MHFDRDYLYLVMKYLFTCIILLPFFALAQQLTKADSQSYREIIKWALTDKTNYRFQINKAIADKETAVSVAEPILFSIYGKDQIIGEKPYNVALIDGFWILTGTLPDGYVGGTFLIIFSAKDGRVIKLTHGK